MVTGAAGFIGSNIVADLEAEDRGPVAACDWFGTEDKWRNLAKRNIAAFVEPEHLIEFLDCNAQVMKAVIHMGAISTTTETDVDLLVKLNINASVALWDWCAAHAVPFIYASSAAIYGGREISFVDDDSPAGLAALRPLNAYGWSKKAVDEIFATRVATGKTAPPHWAGLRFFNVYGPNEYHKGSMKSVAVKLFDAVQASEPIQLFKSHREGIRDGEQRRDFVYVKDCTRVVSWLLDHPEVNGIFNLGTGKARTFLDIVTALGQAMGRKLDVEFVEIPEVLRNKYQYFTEADMRKLHGCGLNAPFQSLEEGVADYVHAYLVHEDRYR